MLAFGVVCIGKDTPLAGRPWPINDVSYNMHLRSGFDTTMADSCAREIRARWNVHIDGLIFTGSGFHYHPIEGTIDDAIPYASLTGLPHGHVPGHSNEFRLLRIGQRYHLLCSGRFHLYEGIERNACLSLVDVGAALNCKRVLLFNAVGGLNPRLSVGSLVLPSELVDLTFTRETAPAQQPIRPCIDHAWRARTHAASLRLGIHVHDGTYVQVLGPSYETRAEIRMLRTLGADIVGMSTTIEARRARQHQKSCLVVSLVTNVLTDESIRTVTHDEVLTVATTANSILCRVLETSVG